MAALEPLCLVKVLQEETDGSHGLTAAELSERLCGNPSELSDDDIRQGIDVLRRLDYPVEERGAEPVRFGFAEARFDNAELMFMADAIQSSKFLTKGMAQNLTEKVKLLCNVHQRESLELSKNLMVEGRVRLRNDKVFYSLDTIQKAIRSGRKIEFQYFNYDLQKKPKLRYGGRLYVRTPVHLIYSAEVYYCIAFDEDAGENRTYRVDRMVDLAMSEEQADPAVQQCFDPANWLGQSFGMYSGEVTMVTMRVSEYAMNAVIDRFGEDVFVTHDARTDSALVKAPVMQADTFFAWVAQFRTGIVIEGPPELRSAYVAFLQDILTAHGSA